MRPRSVLILGGLIATLLVMLAANSTVGRAQGSTPPPYNIASCVPASPGVGVVLGTPVVTRVKICHSGSPVPGFTPPVSTPAACAAPATLQAVSAATLTAYDMCFAPDELTIRANTDVTLTIVNRGKLPHTFTVDALRINVVVGPSQRNQVTINARPGTYEFYDGVPGHRSAGLVGKLIVQ